MTRQSGTIYLYVLVGKDGQPAGVTALGLDNPEVSKALSMAAALVKYKPASCGGQPCEMIYPYYLALSVAN